MATVTAAVFVLLIAVSAQEASRPIDLARGSRIAIVGNTLAERMQHFNHFEALLVARFPDRDLVVRNLARSGDTLTLQPRPLNFGDAAQHLGAQKADVIFAFFGANESFEGEAGLSGFEADLRAYLATQQRSRYNGRSAPLVVLVSPIAHERLARLDGYVDVEARNRELARYTAAMGRVAGEAGVRFVDLFTPSLAAMATASSPLTINGIHLNEQGDRVVATLLMTALGLSTDRTSDALMASAAFQPLRESIRHKNQQFFYRYRPVNAEYVVGRRVDPFGSVNFPGEMKELDRIVADGDRRIWEGARAVGSGRDPVTGQSIDLYTPRR